MKNLVRFLLILFFSANTLYAQLNGKYEFRAVWLTTVGNYDWPFSSNDPPDKQQRDLIGLLDQLKAMNFNAILFHTRTKGDAFYKSDLEPWSEYLTGLQGRPQNPIWDPLEFLVNEGHKRGMEVHAWINPFRAYSASSSAFRDVLHVSNQHPEWMLKVGGSVIINPGIPAARTFVLDVLTDIIKRYDIDGIHYDDFFYPYDDITKNNEDNATYLQYGKADGFGSITTWRLYNVNMFVKGLNERIQALKPHLKHGVSPFGIWRSGNPSGISGLSSVDVLFCDAPTWMELKWIDYLTPQLYWKIGGSQDYKALVNWWLTKMNGRHLYPGLALYRASAETAGTGTVFAESEVPNQVRYNRANKVLGEAYFRTLSLTTYSSKTYADTLKKSLYRYPALTPIMDFKDKTAPNPPQNLDYLMGTNGDPLISWAKPVTTTKPEARMYAVYRAQSEVEPDFKTVTADSRNLIGITGDTFFKDKPIKLGKKYWYYVTSVSSNSIESVEKMAISIVGSSPTDVTEAPVPTAFSLSQNYPNPFSTETQIEFSLDRSQVVSVRIYNTLGQEVARLKDAELMTTGAYKVEWKGDMMNGQPAPSGLYLYVLETDGKRETKRMMKM
jgi:uncharacterized lipoprotein YddW (UPF0748 family)